MIAQIARGEFYPLPLAAREGAAANFLTKSGNLLQIAMPNIARSEATAIRSGTMKAGIIVEGPLILWVFQFGSIILDCPFDVRIIPPDRRWLPDIQNISERLAIEVHLIDTATMRTAGIRYVTLSASLTRRFLEAVQDQIANARDPGDAIARLNRIPIERLPLIARAEKCGGA